MPLYCHTSPSKVFEAVEGLYERKAVMKAKKDVYSISEDKKVVNCDLAGAVFICNDTSNGSLSQCWPGIFGLKKHEGCVEFGRGTDVESAVNTCNAGFGLPTVEEGGYQLWTDEVNAIFYDKCPNEEAWLVIPVGKDWHWYRVDHEIDFS